MKSPLLLVVVAVLLVLASAILLWSPWDAWPTPATGAGAGDAPATGWRQADLGGGKAVAPQDASARTTPPRDTIEPELHGSLSGTFVGPEAGIWPGGGEAQLVPAPRQIEDGPMGLFTLGMEQARTRQRQRLHGIPAKDDQPTEIERLLGRGGAVATADVDASGGFQFANPPAGRFELRLSHPFLDLRRQPRVEIAADRHQDLGLLPTDAVASLMVLVWDRQGRPIADARVEVHQAFDSSQFLDPTNSRTPIEVLRRLVPRDTRTDVRGACLIRALDPAVTWYLSVTKDGYCPSHHVARLTPTSENVLQVEMDTGTALQIAVSRPDGSPCPHARVTIEYLDHRLPAGYVPPMRGPATRLTKEVDIGAEGSRTVTGLIPGRALLRLDTPGYDKQEQQVQLRLDDETQQVRFQLTEGEVVVGKVVDEDDQPVPDAKVLPFRGTTKGPLGLDLTSLVSDVFIMEVIRRGVPVHDDGAFRVGGLQRGESVRLVAVAPGYDNGEVSRVPAGAQNVVCQLRRLASLSGRVTAGDSVPIRDFEVKLSQTSFMVMEKPVAREQFTARESGDFVVETLPRENLKVTITAPGYAPWRGSVDTRQGNADLGEVRLLPAAAITGRVIDPDGKPVATAAIRLVRGGIKDTMAMVSNIGGVDATTDQDGRFELGKLTGRRVKLLVDKAGFAVLKTDAIPIEAGKTNADLVLQLQRGGAIHGTLVDADGKPLAGWRAQGTHTGGVGARVTKTDDQGKFVLSGLAAGPYKVECMPADYASRIGTVGSRADLENLDLTKIIARTLQWVASDRVVVRADEPTELRLVFDKTDDTAQAGMVRLEGHVRIGDRDLGEGLVFTTRIGSTAQGPVARIENGRFTVRQLEPGSYRCRIQGGFLRGSIGKPQVIEVPAAKDGVHRVQLQLPGGELAGRVIYETGNRPAAGIVLSLATSDDTGTEDRQDIGEGTVLTGRDGRFRFRGLDTGRYALFAKESVVERDDAGLRSASLQGIDVRAGEVRDDLVVRLRTGASLHVQVFDETGARRNALVTLLDARGQPVRLFQRSLTDSFGIVQWTGLPEATYRVAVDAPKTAPRVSEPVSLTTGGQQHLEVRLRRGIPVQVALTEGQPTVQPGEPVSYAVWNANGALLRAGQARMDPARTEWSVGELAPGRYRLRLESPRLGVVEGERTVPASGQARWTFPK